MLEGIRRYLFGEPARPESPVAGIPIENREAHHRLMNTAMKMKKVANDLDADANDILELLAKDIKGRGQWGY